jgi:hypothetical protein
MESGNLPNGLPRDYGGFNIGKAKLYSIKNTPMNATELNALKCSMCALLLREPCQVITCGHRYCKTCIDQLTSGGEGPYSCLLDKEVFEINQVKSDKGCLRDLKTLEVDCPMDLQCNWRGKLLDVDVHKERCPNRRMVCIQGCGALLVAKEIEAHLTSECSKRPCTCKDCKRPIPFDTLEEHYGVCEEHPVSCKFCEKQLTARKLLSAHLEQDCEDYCMECQHSSCDFKV